MEERQLKRHQASWHRSIEHVRRGLKIDFSSSRILLDVIGGRKAGLSYVYFLFYHPRVTAGRLAMSFPYTPNLQDEKLESLQTQHEYLKLLRLRHLQWLSSAEKSEIENAHQKIAELIELIND
ncbi:MAG TPA: hypothetical protein VGK56_11930, partial [Anaerolineales bacterium]